MRKCRFCHQEIDDAAASCPHCGKDLFPARAAVLDVAPVRTSEDAQREYLAAAPPTAVPIARVTVVDIDMPFGSMVAFMIKWALAAIPAILILGTIIGFLVGVLAGLLSLGRFT